MPTAIKVAFINFLGTIIGAIIGFISVIISLKYKKQIKTYAENSFVRFLSHEEDFKDILVRVKTICAYTVNSHEIFNKLNTVLEQNPRMSVRTVTLLVRIKANETSSDIELLNRTIELWKKLVSENRIKKLTIIAYDHDPDHYYTLLGTKLLFCGQVFFDNSMPTGTKVDYLPLVYNSSNNLGKRIIKNYQRHFNNTVQRYRDVATLFDSAIQ